MNKITLFIFLIGLLNCSNSSNPNQNESLAQEQNVVTSEFNAYWFAGKAELCRYELDQARYGEMRKGNAVLIFVTEPFSRSKQVKLDDSQSNPSDVEQVLKLNFTKKFNTGIYPYSIITSSFLPLNMPKKPLKVGSSVQEWCGFSFAQLNLKEKDYISKSFSYFESEGDQNTLIGNAFSEDGLWSTIRINPEKLPEGKINILPSLSYLRLAHQPFKSIEATATLSETTFNQLPVQQYTIQYPNRSLKIFFDKNFPFVIQGWEENYDDFGKTLTTKGTLKKLLLSDYWNKHNNSDDGLREEFYK
jgi:hypothetical protein